MEIVGEFATHAAARGAGINADAIVMASESGDGGGEALAEPLTARETEVLALVAEGFSNKAIADRLGISDQTAKFHVASIAGKLGAANRTEAVRRAVRRGLIVL
jgi:DNA-binding NarL/FixJ family response regulator